MAFASTRGGAVVPFAVMLLPAAWGCNSQAGDKPRQDRKRLGTNTGVGTSKAGRPDRVSRVAGAQTAPVGKERKPVPAVAHARAVTGGSRRYQIPTWSPDGRRIAATAAKFAGIYLVDPQTGNEETVTRDMGAGYRFSWSPDGNRIAYLASREAAGRRISAIAVYDRSSRKETLLAGVGGNLGFPVFSTDGKAVYFTAGRQLVKAPASGGKPRKVIDGVQARHVLPLPGGTHVLVDEGRGVASVAVDGSARKAHFQGDGFFGPVLSRDGSRYLVSESRGVRAHQWIYDLKNHRKLDLGPGQAGRFFPAGDWIVFQQNSNDGRRFTSGELWAMRVDGSGRTQLTDSSGVIELNPDVSPDGKRLTYTDAVTGKIFVADIVYR